MNITKFENMSGPQKLRYWERMGFKVADEYRWELLDYTDMEKIQEQHQRLREMAEEADKRRKEYLAQKQAEKDLEEQTEKAVSDALEKQLPKAIESAVAEALKGLRF